MLIQNYGLFWRKDWIHWGRGSNPGHLMGIRVGAKRAHPIDFRDQQGVYCLYDENFRLVYVGQAGGRNKQRLFRRLAQHKRDAISERWSRLSWFGVRQVLKDGSLKSEREAAYPKTGEVLNQIEAILISAAEPVQNRQGGRFGKQVQRYAQFRDEENLEPEMGDMIATLWKRSRDW